MTGSALAALLCLMPHAGAQTMQIDCAGTVSALRASHPNLRCTCSSARAAPSCTDGSSSSAPSRSSSPGYRSSGSKSSNAAIGVQVLKGLQNSMDDMYRNASKNIGAKAKESAALSRALDAQQKKQANESERFLTEAERRKKDADAEKRRDLAGQMIMPTTRGRTPLLMRGDPACPGGPGAECRVLRAGDVPPLSNASEAEAASEYGNRMQEELDAKRGADDVAAMEAKLKRHVSDEYARVSLEKAKGFIEDRSEALSRQINALERVKEQSSIVKNYTVNTLDAFKQKASAAACALGKGGVDCFKAYYDAGRRENGDREAFARRTHDFMGEQFLVPKNEDGAELKDAAAVGFFARFRP